MATLTFNDELIINEETAKRFVELNKYVPVQFDDLNDYDLSTSESEDLAASILNSFECK